MVEEKGAVWWSGLGVALISLMAHVVSFQLNTWLAIWFEFVPGVSLLFLPAGVKLVALMAGGAWGLLGLGLGAMWTASTVWPNASVVVLLADVAVWLLVPFAVLRALQRAFGIRCDLGNLTYLKLLAMGLSAIVVQCLASRLFAVWAHGATRDEWLSSSLAMMVGDFMGLGVMLIMIAALTQAVRAWRLLDRQR